MPPTVYIHLGQEGAGAAAIQAFAAEHRDALQGLGVVYPAPEDIGLEAPARGRGNADGLFAARREPDAALVALAGFAERQEDEQTVLLSSDALLNANGAYMRRVVEAARGSGATVKGLVYLRDQLDWLIARYAQAVEAGRQSAPLAEYLEQNFRSRNLEYNRVLGRNARIFGRENLVVRVYDPAHLEGGDVRVDAFGALGADVRELAGEAPADERPSVEELEVMRYFNGREGGGRFDRAAFRRHAREQAGEEATRDVHRLVPVELMRELQGHFGPINERVRRRYLPDAPSPLFGDPAPDDYEPLSGDAWMTPQAFGLLAGHVLSSGDARRARRTARRTARAEGGDAPRRARGGEPAEGGQAATGRAKGGRAAAGGGRKRGGRRR
jgi:hypothetical protein